MSRDWSRRRLGDVLTLEYGKPLPPDRRDPSGLVPAFGANGVKCWTNETYVDGPSIIVGRKGSAGAVTLADAPFWPLDVTYFVRFDESEHDLQFLFYLLKSLDLASLAKGVKPGLNRNDAYSIDVLVPEREEQQRIASILADAFEAIEFARFNVEGNLLSTQEIFQDSLRALAQESRSWPQALLSEVSIDFGRGRSRHRPRNAPELYGGPYPLVQTGEVRAADHWITDYSQTYSETGLAQSKLWPAGTVCITIAANIAETGVLTFESCFPDSVIGVVTDPKRMNNEFLEYVLQARRETLRERGQGTAQDNINLGTFETEKFPVPELSVQDQVVRSLNALAGELEKLNRVFSRKARALDELQASLLEYALSGHLSSDSTPLTPLLPDP